MKRRFLFLATLTLGSLAFGPLVDVAEACRDLLRADPGKRGQREKNEAEEHERALKHVGPGNRPKTARDTVGQHDSESDQRADEVVPAEKALERCAGRIDLGADVDGDEDHQGSR